MLFSKRFILILSLTFISALIYSQRDYVDADGIIEYHNRIPLPGATLKLYDGEKLVETIKTGENGEYHFKLEYNKEYTLEISKDRLVTKLVKYNTMMPTKIRGAWWIGIPINLYEICPGIDASIFSEPVAVVEFNSKRKQYRANPDHDNRMRSRIKSFEQQNDACLEGEFIKLVRNADELYDQKKYDEALELYEVANEKRPWELHASERLDEIGNKIAQKDASDKVFVNMVKQGDRLLESGNLAAAKNAYKRALVVKPSDSEVRNKITDIDNKLNQSVEQQQQQNIADNQYNQIINQADKALQSNNLSLAQRFYSQALEIKPNESYPQTQISKIKTLTAQQEQKSAENQKKRDEYNRAIANGDAFLSQFKYDEAKASYRAAQQILPSESYPSQKIKEIDETIKRDQVLAQRLAKEKEEQEYNDLIAQADDAFNRKDYQTAKMSYEKLLEIKPFDNYTKQKLSKVNKQIAAQQNKNKQEELDYNRAISAGNLFLEQKKYDLAKNEYNKAIALKPDEVLPKTQIIKINQIQEAEQKQNLARQQKEVDYRMAISTGEKFKTQRNYDAAKTEFQKALVLKPNDALAQSKLKEIASLEQRQQQLAAQQQVNQQYQEAILAGNQLMSQKKYNEAKLKYQAALKLKPSETLPNNKLQEIAGIEQEQARALALEKTREEEYQKTIRTANSALATKDYFNARSMYNQALKYKPNDALATSKINEINQILERQQQQQQALAENERKYNELVSTADKLLNAKDYVRAKSTYNMALALKPEQYPKTQIQKIDNILVLQEQQKQAELERENNFAQAISKADELYNKKDFFNAKEMYEAALKIKPDDSYSKTRVKNITAFLAKIEESKSKTDVKPVAVKAQSTKVLPELKFKDEAELELYKVELRKMYPEGITHEIYTAERQVMDRYIIIRKNETNDYRKIRYSWGGTEHWINDKPCTSMYFNSQTKQRAGEYYNKVEK